MQTVRNPQGIPVKVCCASCAYRQLVDTQARRRCAIREEKVKPNQVCSLWQMSTPLKLVGIGAGMIKRREYLLYYTEQRVEEQERQTRLLLVDYQHLREGTERGESRRVLRTKH